MAAFAQELRTYVAAMSGVTSLLGSDVRFYPGHGPKSPTFPYVVYERLSEAGNHTTSGAVAATGADYQFTIIATTHLSATAVADFFRVGLDGIRAAFGTRWVSGIFLRNERDGIVDRGEGSQTSIFSIQQEYHFAYQRALT